MQDPKADAEWNDILCKKGIPPSKESLKGLDEEQSVVKTYEDMTLEELEEKEDEFNKEDERAIEMIRQQRLAEWKATQLKNKSGEVLEISGKDYVQEVTKASEGLWVVLHFYKQGFPLCALINQHLSGLAQEEPAHSVYLPGRCKSQFIGPQVFGGMKLTRDELEWKLSESGAVKTNLEEKPRKPIEDTLQRDSDSERD
ncbi:hypothetical protein H1C71_004344 [Ictidomys tridecemlineatus]|uniref:Phosducin-like protein 3 n=1 Tax=Ictidomys tridecemlineatus TaxID=43179 RepID=I3MV62_ICTTR|nr:hypothetical protein H1C71_004344 [Ictidomys tridecemlineatus]